MPGVTLNIFENDIFQLMSMSLAIQKLPQRLGILGKLGLFKPQPITTLAATIEEVQGKLSLVETSPRGTRGKEQPREKRTVRAIQVPHLQVDDIIIADAIQNIRAFGNVSEVDQVATIVNNRLQKIKTNIDATREYHRCGALNGSVLEPDGTTEILNIY